MCGPYYDEDDDGNRYVRIQVSNKEVLKKSPVGTKVNYSVEGEVVEVEAHRMVPDYSVDRPEGHKGEWKRPKKEVPGSVRIRLPGGDKGIQFLNDRLMDEEAD